MTLTRHRISEGDHPASNANFGTRQRYSWQLPPPRGRYQRRNYRTPPTRSRESSTTPGLTVRAPNLLIDQLNNNPPKLSGDTRKNQLQHGYDLTLRPALLPEI